MIKFCLQNYVLNLNENHSLALTEISGNISPPKSAHNQKSRAPQTKIALNTFEFRCASHYSSCI